MAGRTLSVLFSPRNLVSLNKTPTLFSQRNISSFSLFNKNTSNNSIVIKQNLPSFSERKFQNPSVPFLSDESKTQGKKGFNIFLGLTLFGVPFGAFLTFDNASAKESQSVYLNLEDTKSLFAKKRTNELIFQWFILKLCSYSIIVENGQALMGIMQKYNYLSRLSNWVMKKTFFKQFCAGEDLPQTLQAVDKLYTNGMSSILDFSVEKGDSPEELNQNTQTIIQTIDAAANSPEKLPFACLKLTGLTNHDLLLRLSELIAYKQKNPSFKVSFIDGKSSSEKGAPAPLSEAETKLFLQLQERLDTLCKKAHDKNVRLLIDAEQTYFQPAIDFLAMQMASKYNKKTPIIHNTYQMYLKDSLSRLKSDISEAKKQGIKFGVKMVRGAYMEQERSLSQKKGTASPVHDSIEDTHQNYNAGLEVLLDQVSNSSVLIATHNQESIELTISKMKEKNIPLNHKNVYVGQLYGMCDHLSFGAAQQGLNVCKYVPFGPVGAVMPYLGRRMIENKGVVQRTIVERSLLFTEIKRRLKLKIFGIGN